MLDYFLQPILLWYIFSATITNFQMVYIILIFAIQLHFFILFNDSKIDFSSDIFIQIVIRLAVRQISPLNFKGLLLN